jgi:purine-binding chemotaxis protein CheW
VGPNLDRGCRDFDTPAFLNPSPLQSALEKAPERASAAVARPETELFCFTVGNLGLAFASTYVREVVRLTPLTPLPRTPAFLLGVCGHRGEVLPVFDLLRYLGKGERNPGPRSRLVVGISGSWVAAFMADQVLGLRTVPLADLQQAPMGGDSATEHLEAVVARPNTAALHVINLPRLLQSIRQRVVTR